MKRFEIIRLTLCIGFLLTALDVYAANSDKTADAKPALPKLVDLGAGKCIPCKQMKPILDELKRDYASQFETIFIDVWENPDEGRKYKIRLIPTQIFYDASGKELARHEGFMAKKDILTQWEKVGITIKNPEPKPNVTKTAPQNDSSLLAQSSRTVTSGNL
ncbi:thiol-disulfide isomerase/thioredoxin [Ereboglobus sp. PH5-10]|uniref:thioredoxin family protein n=1 Tax=Ereboglobus sp. PH5-10 TaxID=2940629 RepID=UPI002404DF26|nr:thioredoxin family protein [Ereboglobus sp. PH5-10]MDF9828533.1 thiol-disulfide isomerase/thioredoxin [Ereboglobus sp. PH5-10]